MRRTVQAVGLMGVVTVALSLVTGAQVGNPSITAEIQLQLGSLLFAEGRYVEALDAFQRALAADDPMLRLQARKQVVRAALRSAEFSVAAEEATRLVNSGPRDAEVLSLYGDALWSVGLFDAAEAAFSEALSVAPSSARARHGVARSLLGRNQLEPALGEALVAMASAPGDAELRTTLGYIYERLGRFDAAAEEFLNVIRLLPQKDRTPHVAFLRQQAAYLRTYGNKTPNELVQPPGTTVHTLPFKEERGKVVVQARINRGDWVDVVIDTGAERTVLSRAVAERYNVAPLVTTLSAGVGQIGIRDMQMGTIDSLEIGSLLIKNVPCLIKNPPLTGLPTREGEAFSPLALGLSMRIDYRTRQLTIGTRLPDLPADIELPLRVHRLATVQGLVDNARRVNFVVDTGGEVISISQATARALNKPLDLRRIPLKVYGTSGWDPEAYLLPGVDLAFDTLRFQNLPVVVLNLEAPSVLLGYQLGGIVGHMFLSKYRVDLDLERSVLRLKKL